MAKLENVKTIDMVNGEITKVEYNGDIYVKVDEGQGTENIGDIVIGKKGKGRDDSYFEIVEISSFNSSRSGKFYDEDDDLDGMLYYEVFRKQSAPSATASLDERVSVLESKVATLEGEPVAQPLKVGDYAKVVIDATEYNAGTIKRGEIAEVTEIDNSSVPYQLTSLASGDDVWAEGIHIVRATDEEVAEAKAQAEQAAVDAKWAKIGRKPNEFKKGDIVYASKSNNHPNGVLASVHRGPVGSIKGGNYHLNNDTDVALGDRLELITPVESRFDRA